jgi:hypothetical protein
MEGSRRTADLCRSLGAALAQVNALTEQVRWSTPVRHIAVALTLCCPSHLPRTARSAGVRVSRDAIIVFNLCTAAQLAASKQRERDSARQLEGTAAQLARLRHATQSSDGAEVGSVSRQRCDV